MVPDLEWDFRLEKVISINVSGHKYGLVSLPAPSQFTITPDTKFQRCIPVLAGSSGDPQNICLKSLFLSKIQNSRLVKSGILTLKNLVSTILARTKPHSPSTSPKVPRKSLDNVYLQTLKPCKRLIQSRLPNDPPRQTRLPLHHDQSHQNIRLLSCLPRATWIHHHE